MTIRFVDGHSLRYGNIEIASILPPQKDRNPPNIFSVFYPTETLGSERSGTFTTALMIEPKHKFNGSFQLNERRYSDLSENDSHR